MIENSEQIDPFCNGMLFSGYTNLLNLFTHDLLVINDNYVSLHKLTEITKLIVNIQLIAPCNNSSLKLLDFTFK